MDLSLSFAPNYFSLEEIMATQIKIPCRTTVKLPGFGFMDASQSSSDLPEGTELELPLWLAEVLAKPPRNCIVVNVPKTYNEAHQEVLKADSTVVDLNKLGPHFYQSGLHISSLPGDQAERIGSILPIVLQKRLQALSDCYSFTAAVQGADDATCAQKGTLMKESYMDALEARIYADAKVGSEEMSYWLDRKEQ